MRAHVPVCLRVCVRARVCVCVCVCLIPCLVRQSNVSSGDEYCNISVCTDLVRLHSPSIIQVGKRLPASSLVSGSCGHAYRSRLPQKRTVGHGVRRLDWELFDVREQLV